ncbi:hypothetical protein GCM10028828_09080 [Corynebacterium tapiri]
MGSRWMKELRSPHAPGFLLCYALLAASIALPFGPSSTVVFFAPIIGTIQMVVAFWARPSRAASLSAVAGALVFVGLAFFFPLLPLAGVGILLSLVAAGFEWKQRLTTR